MTLRTARVMTGLFVVALFAAPAFAQDGYRMQTLITEIVTSYPFTQRRIQ